MFYKLMLISGLSLTSSQTEFVPVFSSKVRKSIILPLKNELFDFDSDTHLYFTSQSEE